jgi:putative membrane protein
MEIVAYILIGLIAVLHLYILWFEMFAWETKGPKVFSNFPKDLFPATKAMAANQGLYNGFLAAGLIWSFFISDLVWKDNVSIFFLACVGIAGIYGSITASKRIIFVQTIPAAIAIVFVLIK